MPRATQTAVIVPVGAAEAAVAHHRRRLDVAASWGVPAHVTVVYPFVPPTDVDEAVISRLTAVFAAALPFTCTFDRCAWFGKDVLWLAPDPAQEFRHLTEAVVERFPDHPPYGGAYDEVIPHLTVGESRRGTPDDLRAAESDVRTRLPITARIDSALLIAGTDQPDSWHTLAELPFGPSRPGPAELSGR